MSTAAVTAVRAALERVVDPCSIATGVPISLPDMGLIRDVRAEGDEVVVEMRLTSPFCFQIGLMLERIEAVTADLPEVGSVRVEVDHGDDWLPDMIAPESRRRLREVRPLEALRHD